MQPAPRQGRSKLLLLLLIPLGLLAIAGLGYWMFYGGARPAVDAYVAEQRARKANPEPVTDDDLRDCNAIIAQSSDLTIKNFATKSTFDSGTGCYWGKLATPKGEVDVSFYVEKKGSDWHVIRASTTKECRCAHKGGSCNM